MKSFASWFGSGALAIALALAGLTPSAFADGYTIYDLGNDNSHGIYGIDPTGDIVIWSTSGCGSFSYCYSTFSNGVAASDGGVPPVLDYDDGTACASGPEGFSVSRSVCNNGWTGFGASYNPNGDPNGIYLMSGSEIDFLGSGAAGQLFLNASGDFAWTDGASDEMFVAMQNPDFFSEATEFSVKQDVVAPDPVPEPAALFLLATGLMALTFAVRVKGHS